MQQILGIINLALDINATGTQQVRRWFQTKDNPPVSVVPPEAVSFTLSSLASWVSISAATEAIADLQAQIMHLTGEDDPLIVLKLGPSMMTEVQAAWQPYVAEFRRKHAAGRRPIKPTTGLAPFSSPSKENEDENENGTKRLSFSSPLGVAPQLTVTNSGERRVSRLPAPLPTKPNLNPNPIPTPKPIPKSCPKPMLPPLLRLPVAFSRADR